MNTIVCAEILGPFKKYSNNSRSLNNLSTVYIEFPDIIDEYDKNQIKLQFYLNNKHILLKDINVTMEDEQPIEPGVFIITNIMIMDEYMTQIINSEFIGLNVINKNNSLSPHNKHTYINNSLKIKKKEPEIFFTPDGIGFTVY